MGVLEAKDRAVDMLPAPGWVMDPRTVIFSERQYPTAIVWKALVGRRPNEAISFFTDNRRAEIGLCTTPELHAVLQSVYEAPEFIAVNAVLQHPERRPEREGSFPEAVRSAAWDPETVQRAILLGCDMRIVRYEKRAEHGQSAYDRDAPSVDEIMRGAAQSFVERLSKSHLQSEVVVRHNSAGNLRDRVKELKDLANELSVGNLKPLTIRELNSLIAELVDRELAASAATATELE